MKKWWIKQTIIAKWKRLSKLRLNMLLSLIYHCLSYILFKSLFSSKLGLEKDVNDISTLLS